MIELTLTPEETRQVLETRAQALLSEIADRDDNGLYLRDVPSTTLNEAASALQRLAVHKEAPA